MQSWAQLQVAWIRMNFDNKTTGSSVPKSRAINLSSVSHYSFYGTFELESAMVKNYACERIEKL